MIAHARGFFLFFLFSPRAGARGRAHRRPARPRRAGGWAAGSFKPWFKRTYYVQDTCCVLVIFGVRCVSVCVSTERIIDIIRGIRAGRFRGCICPVPAAVRCALFYSLNTKAVRSCAAPNYDCRQSRGNPDRAGAPKRHQMIKNQR